MSGTCPWSFHAGGGRDDGMEGQTGDAMAVKNFKKGKRDMTAEMSLRYAAM